MTDILYEKFEKLEELELPNNLHARIMNRVIAQRSGKAFSVVLTILLANIILAGFFFVIRLIDNDAFTFINFMIREFEFNLDYFIQFLRVFYHNVPVGLAITLFLNIVLLGYVSRLYFSMKNVGRAFLLSIN